MKFFSYHSYIKISQTFVNCTKKKQTHTHTPIHRDTQSSCTYKQWKEQTAKRKIEEHWRGLVRHTITIILVNFIIVIHWAHLSLDVDDEEGDIQMLAAGWSLHRMLDDVFCDRIVVHGLSDEGVGDDKTTAVETKVIIKLRQQEERGWGREREVEWESN